MGEETIIFPRKASLVVAKLVFHVCTRMKSLEGTQKAGADEGCLVSGPWSMAVALAEVSSG